MNLAKHRKAAGLTQDQMGRALGIHNRRTIGKWEADPGGVRLSRLEDYAQACGVTLGDLLGYDGEAQARLDLLKEAISASGIYKDDQLHNVDWLKRHIQ